MSLVFVNYRFAGGSLDALLLARDLKASLGAERVFIDQDELRPGVRYSPLIWENLLRADVLVALITENWLGERPEGRLIDRPEDWVRREIASALGREVPIVPVFLDGLHPRDLHGRLPEDITGLLKFHASFFREDTACQDLDYLVKAVVELLEKAEAAGGSAPPAVSEPAPPARASGSPHPAPSGAVPRSEPVHPVAAVPVGVVSSAGGSGDLREPALRPRPGAVGETSRIDGAADGSGAVREPSVAESGSAGGVVPPPWGSSEPWGRSRVRAVVGAALAVLVLVAGIGWRAYGDDGGSGADPGSGSAAGGTSPSGPPPSAGSPGGAGTDGAGTDGAASAVGLGDLTPGRGAGIVRSGGAVTLGGTTYPDSVEIQCRYNAREVVEFELGGGYTRLTGTFGMVDPDDGDATGSMRILGGDGAEWTDEVAPNQDPRPVVVDLTGGDKLLIRLTCRSADGAVAVLAGTSVT